jgi:CO/xanthine dehydrogenase Mo-binding subunit
VRADVATVWYAQLNLAFAGKASAKDAMAKVDEAAKAARGRLGNEPMSIEVAENGASPGTGSYCVQIAQVAVDPETGQLRVLEILTAVDVAEIVNPKAHQMQIDGGTLMGYGYACLEDLDEADGQVWAANLGEFKLPSPADVPPMRTVLVPGGRGVGSANVKTIGGTTNCAVAPAIANAVASATSHRLRRLPITAERIFAELNAGGQ